MDLWKSAVNTFKESNLPQELSVIPGLQISRPQISSNKEWKNVETLELRTHDF